MRTLRYVVTGPARSGTKYVAHLLTAAGLRCGHEDVFNRWGPDGTKCPDWRSSDLSGDSSFIAAPFTAELADGRLAIVHLVRPPLDHVRSVVGLGHLGDKEKPWVRFIDAHTGVTEHPPGPRRAAAYWLAWNAMAARHAHFRWRLGAITAADVEALAERAGINADPARVALALAETSDRINHRQRAEWVTLDDLGPLGDQVIEAARQYGVPLEASSPLHTGGVIAEADAPTLSGGCVEIVSAVEVVSVRGGMFELVRDGEVVERVRGRANAEAKAAELG